MNQYRVIDVIEYNDPTGTQIVHKEPQNGGDIRYGAQLIVRETQAAVFFKDGRALDVMGPGRHTLTTNNIPVLSDYVSKIMQGGQTPFQAEVYFVSTKIFQDMKWGTPTPIDMADPDFGIISIRAFGTYTIKIIDPQLFVTTLVGDQGAYDTTTLEKFLKSAIRTRFNDLVSEQFKSYLKIRSDFDELSAAMKFKVKEDFEKYGIEIRDFYINDISVPEDVQQAFKERTKMGALGDMGKYMQYKAANALGDMATRPAGGGTDPMSAGMGMGMGMMMPQMMAQSMQNAMGGQTMGQAQPQAPMGAPVPGPMTGAVAQGAICPNCHTQNNSLTKFCPECGSSMAPPKPKCTNCQAEYTPGAKFCPECGKPVGQAATVNCAKCNAQMPAGTKFCPECGAQAGQ